MAPVFHMALVVQTRSTMQSLLRRNVLLSLIHACAFKSQLFMELSNVPDDLANR